MGIVALACIVIIMAGIILGWNKRFGYVQMLVFTNLLVFFVMVVGEAITDDVVLPELGARPVYLTTGERPWTILTHMFSHASFVHVIGNVLFMFLIGVQLEYRVGRSRAFVIYFLSGLVALFAESFILGLGSKVLMVGASGAVSGLIGAIFMLYPRDRIPMLLGPIFLLNVPVYLAAGGFLATQLVLDLASISSGPAGGVAYGAHLAGFVAGMILAVALPRPVTRAREKADLSTLEELATTDDLRAELERIKNETEPAVRDVWLEHFINRAKCPQCGEGMKLKGVKAVCRNGHEVRLR
ncbi:MAG: rhomboid family intramembrane serine protease [Methanomassiliicoccales archaeon]|nr:MAG: rhomboid family intramembrane serine protease [Methanomassiliicoccales archaeon]